MICAVIVPRKSANDKPFGIFGQNRIEKEAVQIPYATEKVLIVTLPYMAEQLLFMPQKRLAKLLKKCRQLLKCNSVKCVYISKPLRNISMVRESFYDFTVPDGSYINRALVDDFINFAVHKTDIDLCNAEIGIWQKRFDDFGNKVLEYIGGKAKYITVFSQNAITTRVYTDNAYEKSGLAVKVSSNIDEINRCDMIILLDELSMPITREDTVIADVSRRYRYRCYNSANFSVPFGFNAVTPYFDTLGESEIEFLCYACGINPQNRYSIKSDLTKIGCRMNNILYRKYKILDNSGKFEYNM